MLEINIAFASDAFRGTSFSPEKRGERFVKDVQEHLDYITQWAAQWRTAENCVALDEALDYYRTMYVSNAREYLAAHSRCISSFIAGPSGFPVERAKKANARADKRLNDWLEWSNRQRDVIRRRFNPNAPQIISADDEDAIAKLEAKRDRLQLIQEAYKAANKIARNAKLDEEEKRRQLLDLDFDEKTVYECLHPRWGKLGFESYILTNNNANIKRIEDRIKALEREAAHRAASPTEYEMNGVRVVESDDDNRLKLYFPGKPEMAMIASLKAHGFHWSPRETCWMRLLNNNARYAMREVLKCTI